MKTYRSLCCVLLVALATALVAGGQPRKGDPPPSAMQRKLGHAQKALEGIALNDFDGIVRSADGLIDASREASFQVLKTRRYELYADEFRRAAEGMRKHARVKNTDAAALSYVDLTLTCVKCHQHVREERVGLAPPVGRPATAATLTGE